MFGVLEDPALVKSEHVVTGGEAKYGAHSTIIFQTVSV